MLGSSLVLMERFDAEETLRLIDRHHVTWVYLVPAMMGRIWRLPTEVREVVAMFDTKENGRTVSATMTGGFKAVITRQAGPRNIRRRNSHSIPMDPFSPPVRHRRRLQLHLLPRRRRRRSRREIIPTEFPSLANPISWKVRIRLANTSMWKAFLRERK